STNLDHTLKINASPRQPEAFLEIKEANNNNLKNINIQIPKQVLVAVSGVSGSGKSSLMLEAFATDNPEAIMVVQGSDGISSRSTMATYIGIMDDIRGTFAKGSCEIPGLFSFNSKDACPVCKGKGMTQPDFAFAYLVTVTCEACDGT